MQTILTKETRDVDVLMAAHAAWQSASDLRRRRLRYKRFTYGDQWSDPERGNDGRWDTAYNVALRDGRRPMTNNMIRRLVKCVIGRFRQLAEEETRDGAVKALLAANEADELDARCLEEFLISGCAIQRVWRERRPEGEGVWVDNVSPARFFVNAYSDPRGHDTELVGMLRDMSVAEVVMRFAEGDVGRARALRRLYAEMQPAVTSMPLGADGGAGENFFEARGGRCRVVEVWTLEAAESLRCHDRLAGLASLRPVADREEIEAENERRRKCGLPLIDVRWQTSAQWRGRWLAPDGTLLGAQDAGPDGAHPFVVKLYPLTDGEVHSMVEDVIDQQLCVNRLITMIDHIIGASAKGVLLFPVHELAKGFDWETLARAWASPNGVIPYNPDGQTEPRQVATNATDIGARELLTLQMQMFEDISGVSNALMGRASDGGNVGFERYDAQVKNALTAIYDLLLTFMHFRERRSKKMLAW